MYKFLTCLTVISTFIFPVLSFAGEFSVDEVRELYRDMYRYMIVKDVSRLGSLLDDSFVLIHMTGMRQSKQEYLEAIKNGTLNYFSEELEDISVKITKNNALVFGQSRVSAAVFGGSRHTWRLELEIDLVNKNGQWLMIQAKASTY